MNTTITSLSFLEKLRNATAQSHTDLEQLSISASIINPEVTNEEYILYLSLMQDVVTDAEENIFPKLKGIITDLEERKKASFIMNDLRSLGFSKATSVKPLSGGLNNPTAGFALGIMYVIEGSSLGGRVILKNISSVLGYDSENSAAYFNGYGGETGSYWKKFISMLVSYEEDNNCGDDIIAGANFAFTAINDHFIKNTSR